MDSNRIFSFKFDVFNVLAVLEERWQWLGQTKCVFLCHILFYCGMTCNSDSEMPQPPPPPRHRTHMFKGLKLLGERQLGKQIIKGIGLLVQWIHPSVRNILWPLVRIPHWHFEIFKIYRATFSWGCREGTDRKSLNAICNAKMVDMRERSWCCCCQSCISEN